MIFEFDPSSREILIRCYIELQIDLISERSRLKKNGTGDT